MLHNVWHRIFQQAIQNNCCPFQIMKWNFEISIIWAHHSFTTQSSLTHWGRVTHIWAGNLTILGSDNGLSPGWRQAIIWTNVGTLLIGPLGTNFSEILIETHTFSLKKMHFKMSGKWRPFSLGLNVLTSLPQLLCHIQLCNLSTMWCNPG